MQPNALKLCSGSSNCNASEVLEYRLAADKTFAYTQS
jgi:hypothetical protein